MSGVPREVLKWLQSLDLSWKITVPKWDLTNGYLVGEILSRYYHGEINMLCYDKCATIDHKMLNWSLIKEFIRTKQLDVPQGHIEGTIHTKEGAATLLLEQLFHILTHRVVNKMPPLVEPDYTDHPYQLTLPLHAQCTASTAVKTNLRLTEVIHDGSPRVAAEKAQKIIDVHLDERQRQRQDDPKRFGIVPTLGERCVRKCPDVSAITEEPLKCRGSSRNSLGNLQSDLSITAPKPDLMEILQ
ncbi:hypothetical protein ACOMHN_028222 [Nucella lapillus]